MVSCPDNLGFALPHRHDPLRSLNNHLCFSYILVQLYPANRNSRIVSKYIFGDTSKQTLLELPQGQLYLVRPLSPKGYSELIFRDAAASIRRTGTPHQYQLIVQRIYEEGEAELLAEEEEVDDNDSPSGLRTSERDEKGFLLDESLHLRTEEREGGEFVIAWRDLSGDVGDLYEFVCDPSLKSADVSQFELAAIECQFERKFRRDHGTATEQELAQFSFAHEEPIPAASASPSARTPNLSPTRSLSRTQLGAEEMAKKVESPAGAASAQTPVKTPAHLKSPAKPSTPQQTVAPKAAKHPKDTEVLISETAELHLFDFESGTFILQDAKVTAKVSEVGTWKYWLQITGDENDWLGRAIEADLNPVFNFEYLSLIFNQYTDDGSGYSWLLRFKNQTLLEEFQGGLMQALWEHLHQMKWAKQKQDDQDYIVNAFNDLVLENDPYSEPTARDLKELEEEEQEDESEPESDDSRPQNEEYDTDEEEEDVDVQGKSKDANSLLAVGYKHDRSFVVRGDKIGVFRHTPSNHLKFDTAISGIKTPKGKMFSPMKIMLHSEDSNMILQNEDNPNSLFRMDLETGKVVDEWKIHDDIQVNTFAPSNKYAQMTAEQTLVGVSSNGLYRIDPRLAGNKLVDSESKQYSSVNGFTAAATTEKGYIAVASKKGDIGMFDRLGINAKTHIPALGDEILGVDVSADGRWILATCKTYLLLIDAMQQGGKNEGSLGFEKRFAADSKPVPRRLTIKPEHVAQMSHETKSGLSFTQAHFNAGIDSNETTIVTASGPFVIIWSMKKILKKMADQYSIKRYEQVIKADNFKYGTDKNMIIALPDEVDMVRKSTLKRPTRESIAGPLSGTPSRFSTPMKSSGRGTRGSYLKNQIVDSPY